MKKLKKTNVNLVNLITEMKKLASEQNVKLWKRIATDLEKPTRLRRVVNISRLAKFTKADDVVVVPGKVLGTGDLTHKLTVAAFSFSESAKRKINSKGKAIPLEEFIKMNPKGSKIKIIG